jgi:hypothetical protein
MDQLYRLAWSTPQSGGCPTWAQHHAIIDSIFFFVQLCFSSIRISSKYRPSPATESFTSFLPSNFAVFCLSNPHALLLFFDSSSPSRFSPPSTASPCPITIANSTTRSAHHGSGLASDHGGQCLYSEEE